MYLRSTCPVRSLTSNLQSLFTLGYFLLIGQKLHLFFVSELWQDVTGSEIGKFGEEDEKCCIRKCNKCVTHMWPICDSSDTRIRSIYDLSHGLSKTGMEQCLNQLWLIYDPSVSYPWPICDSCNLSCDPRADRSLPHMELCETHLWSFYNPSCDSYMTQLLCIGWSIRDLSVTPIYDDIFMYYYKENLWLF